MQPILGSKRLAEITPFDLERYRRQRKQAGVGDVSINRELAFLRNLYTMAIAWGKASENPVKKVRFARENNGRTRFLTREEEVRLLACCIPSLKPLVVTALHTGFRMSELLSLTWHDVDFHRCMITVRAAYAKNGESRSIPMNSVLIEMLCAMQGDTLGMPRCSVPPKARHTGIFGPRFGGWSARQALTTSDSMTYATVLPVGWSWPVWTCRQCSPLWVIKMLQ